MKVTHPERPVIYWLDLSRQNQSTQTARKFATDFVIEPLDEHTSARQIATRADMLCVEFDKPDAGSLQRLLELLHSHPAIPLTMLSVQHSEELAVWAFRSGVWEYLTLPLGNSEYSQFRENALRQIRQQHLDPGHPPLQRVTELPSSVSQTARSLLPLHEVQLHLDQHFRERIEEADMARMCCMSPAHFSRTFKQHFGIGFQEYITRRRMVAALELLQSTRMPVSSVAYTLGYRDPSYFARAFRRHYGLSPSAYRQPDRPPPKPDE